MSQDRKNENVIAGRGRNDHRVRNDDTGRIAARSCTPGTVGYGRMKMGYGSTIDPFRSGKISNSK